MFATGSSLEDFIEQWINAESRGDVTELRRMLDDEFLAVSDGLIMRKVAWLQRYQQAKLVHNRMRWSTALRVERTEYALVTGTLEQSSSFEGHDASGAYDMTLVINRSDRPLLLGVHMGARTLRQSA